MKTENDHLDKQMLRLDAETKGQKSENMLKLQELNNKLERVKQNLEVRDGNCKAMMVMYAKIKTQMD